MSEQFTILFVEDDTGVRASTEQLLATKGFRLLVASDGKEALRLLAENHVDVLFTDIVMPDLDGIALAKQAKRLHPDLKIMFMTAYYSRAAEATELGYLLFKPVRHAQISEALERLTAAEC
jgi:two-component system, cell cycle sensor histidine kinase and response regulator CckA